MSWDCPTNSSLILKQSNKSYWSKHQQWNFRPRTMHGKPFNDTLAVCLWRLGDSLRSITGARWNFVPLVLVLSSQCRSTVDPLVSIFTSIVSIFKQNRYNYPDWALKPN